MVQAPTPVAPEEIAAADRSVLVAVVAFALAFVAVLFVLLAFVGG